MRAALYISACLFAAIGTTAVSAPLTLTYDSYTESKTLQTLVDAATPLRLDGAIPDRGGGALLQSLTFRAGSTDLSMSAGWRVLPTEIRTVGVNIDLFDSTNALVASDAFGGVNSGLAQSQFTATGLLVGALYTLRLSGTVADGGRYQVDLAAGATPPPVPPTPADLASPDVSQFDTLTGVKTYGGTFDPGDTLQLDGIFSESGAISNLANFRVTGGTLSAGITWLVAPGAQRTVGVNVDLFDAFNALVASDNFMGITDGQAFSSFVATGLAPGDYRLAFSGNALQGGRYRINLGTDLTPPTFSPISTAVPEPQSWALLLAGFAGIGALIRGRRSTVAA